MYDLPRSSPVQPPSPLHQAHTSKRRHRSRRSHSPVPRISTLLPHHPSQYSPSTRAADITRLLDPAYSSSSSVSPGTVISASSSRAYVDHRGDLHDPDYRDFPLIQSKTTTAQRRSSMHSTRSLSVPRDGLQKEGYTQQLQHRYSMNITTNVRPDWERDWTVEDDNGDQEADEEADETATYSSHSHFDPFVSESRTRRFTPAPNPHQYSPPRWFSEPESMEPSPVSLDDEDNTLQLVSSPFDNPLEEERVLNAEEHSLKPYKHHNYKRGSTVKREKERLVVAEVEKPRHDASERNAQPIIEDDDAVPSCTHALRRHWQAITLRFRFNAFHVKRRLQRSFR